MVSHSYDQKKIEIFCFNSRSLVSFALFQEIFDFVLKIVSYWTLFHYQETLFLMFVSVFFFFWFFFRFCFVVLVVLFFMCKNITIWLKRQYWNVTLICLHPKTCWFCSYESNRHFIGLAHFLIFTLNVTQRVSNIIDVHKYLYI